VTDRVSGVDAKNPYVGPRAFRSGEDLPAREQEIQELTDLLIAERFVLLHAPSGAGKTSLIQAGVAPLLERGPLLRERPFRPTRPLRVKTPPAADYPVHNRYVYSLALDLLPDRDPAQLVALTLPDVVEAAIPLSESRIPVLVFDQFEEILVLDPTDWDNQEVFFAELGSVLADNLIWALFAMREDYMGGLDRYVHHIPGYLQTTYRLDFLDIEAAKIAIRQPAAKQGVTVTDEATDELTRQLRTMRVQGPSDGIDLVEGPYVQPFQLQVVCRNLWKTLTKEKGGRFTTIDLDRVKRHADVGRSLRHYYRDTVTDVATATGADELLIRDWFETQLITAQGFRNQTLTGPQSGMASPATVALALQDAYLVRSDTRAGAIWYELTHDQLITPILDDNRNWRSSRLESWQLRARDWQTKRQAELLLTGPDLRHARRRADAMDITPAEREFLDESARVERDRGLIAGIRYAMGVLGCLTLVLLVAVLVLLFLLLWG
jgi:hypothetical protein